MCRICVYYMSTWTSLLNVVDESVFERICLYRTFNYMCASAMFSHYIWGELCRFCLEKNPPYEDISNDYLFYLDSFVILLFEMNIKAKKISICTSLSWISFTYFITAQKLIGNTCTRSSFQSKRKSFLELDYTSVDECQYVSLETIMCQIHGTFIIDKKPTIQQTNIIEQITMQMDKMETYIVDHYTARAFYLGRYHTNGTNGQYYERYNNLGILFQMYLNGFQKNVVFVIEVLYTKDPKGLGHAMLMTICNYIVQFFDPQFFTNQEHTFFIEQNIRTAIQDCNASPEHHVHLQYIEIQMGNPYVISIQDDENAYAKYTQQWSAFCVAYCYMYLDFKIHNIHMSINDIIICLRKNMVYIIHHNRNVSNVKGIVSRGEAIHAFIKMYTVAIVKTLQSKQDPKSKMKSM
jgi:hypothetical protein